MICSGRNLQLQAPVRVRVFDAKCRCRAKCRIKILLRNFGANDLFWLYPYPAKAFKILEHLLCCLVPGAMSAKGLQNLRGAPLRAVHWVRESTFSWKNYRTMSPGGTSLVGNGKDGEQWLITSKITLPKKRASKVTVIWRLWGIQTSACHGFYYTLED